MPYGCSADLLTKSSACLKKRLPTGARSESCSGLEGAYYRLKTQMPVDELGDGLSTAECALDTIFAALISGSDGPDGVGRLHSCSHHVQSLPRYLKQLHHVERVLSSIKAVLSYERDYAYSPISRLPPELLTSIFLELHSALIAPKDDPTKDISQLLSVSKLWRDVALGESRLWTHIHVKWPERRQELWLQRARSRPLTIIANCRNDTKANATSRLAISHCVVQQSGRWRAVHARNFNQADVDAFLVPFVFRSKDLSSLEELTLEAGDWFSWHRGDFNSPPFALFSENPDSFPPFRISSLSMSAVRLPNPEQLVQFLTHLRITGTPYPLNVLARVLRSCSSLESLDLIDYFIHHEEILAYIGDAGDARIQLPNLKRMSVQLSGWHNALLAFLCINIVSPELEEFILDVKRKFVESPRGSRISGLEQFTKNCPKLKKLTLLYDTTITPNILFSLPTEVFPLLHTLDRSDPKSSGGGITIHFSCDPTRHGRRCLVADIGYPKIGHGLEGFVGARAGGDRDAIPGGAGVTLPGRLAKLILAECPDERKAAWLCKKVDEIILG